MCDNIIDILSLLLNCGTLAYMIYGFNKKKNQYEVRQKAVFDSLSLLDDYFSMKKIGDRKLTTKDDISTNQIVIREREIYSNLIVTCKNAKIPNTFIDIITKDEVKLEELYNYRKLCRKELGLSKKIDLDENKIYITD